MKILRTIVTVGVLVVALAASAHGQNEYSDLNIFGYLQAAYVDISGSVLGPRSTTFFLQQANVMAAKEFDNHFSSFLNLEFTNSYNSQLGWGNLNLEEGWVKYRYSSAFNVKAGYLLPTFNAMLQVRNRTPLLPYIVRPLVYEPLMTDRINIDAFLPARANIELYGSVPLYDAELDYAFFTGNSESSYIISGHGTGFQVSGMDTTVFKLWGGRVGVSTPWMRGGFSMTIDKENQAQFGMGAVQRFRYGVDLSVHVSRFSFDGEVLLVRPHMDDRQQGIFSTVRAFIPMVGNDINRHFLYGTLLWDITDAVYVYGSCSSLQMGDYKGIDEGVNQWSIGGGWRPIDAIVVKAQYVKITCNSPVFPLDIGIPVVAISVMF